MGVLLQGSMVYCRDMNMSTAGVVQSEQEFLEAVRLKGLAWNPRKFCSSQMGSTWAPGRHNCFQLT